MWEIIILDNTQIRCKLSFIHIILHLLNFNKILSKAEAKLDLHILLKAL